MMEVWKNCFDDLVNGKTKKKKSKIYSIYWRKHGKKEICAEILKAVDKLLQRQLIEAMWKSEIILKNWIEDGILQGFSQSTDSQSSIAGCTEETDEKGWT